MNITQQAFAAPRQKFEVVNRPVYLTFLNGVQEFSARKIQEQGVNSDASVAAPADPIEMICSLLPDEEVNVVIKHILSDARKDNDGQCITLYVSQGLFLLH